MSQAIDTTGTLEKAVACFGAARKRMAEGSAYLYMISEQKLWDNGQYSSFGEFAESGCGISEAMASKLVKVYKYYVVDNAISLRKLEELDTEKAYLAINLNGQPEHKLLKASEWNRQELKDALAENPDGSECGHKVLIIKHQCKACSRFIDVN